MALERDPPMDLEEFYHEVERFLQQEDAKADREEEVNAVRGGGPSGEGTGKRTKESKRCMMASTNRSGKGKNQIHLYKFK